LLKDQLEYIKNEKKNDITYIVPLSWSSMEISRVYRLETKTFLSEPELTSASLCGTVYSSLRNRRGGRNKSRAWRFWRKEQSYGHKYTYSMYLVNNHQNNLYVLSNKAVGPGIKSKINKRRA
jgi:hypothetical protein